MVGSTLGVVELGVRGWVVGAELAVAVALAGAIVVVAVAVVAGASACPSIST
jgi:hypothetical protein